MLIKVLNNSLVKAAQNNLIYLPVIIVLVYLIFANLLQSSSALMLETSLYSLLGIIGAIFANLSGAGGGIVFIPVFNYLGFSDAQILSTSFSIQCFGMTAGALTWYRHYKKTALHDPQWHSFLMIILLTALMSIMGIWTAFSDVVAVPASLSHLFSIFSIVLGLSLFVQIFILRRQLHTRTVLSAIDYVAFVLIGFFGGLITAWLSIGVGELLVLYLIFRGFNITMSIAAAVVVTALTVWCAAVEHLWLNSATVWQVALFAGPGAIIGGVLAKTIAAKISTRNLKLVLAIWILAMGLAG